MKYCKTTYLLSVYLTSFLLMSYNATSQSIHFSQAFSSHLTLNPANTGRFNGDWRAVGMYRQQGRQMTNDYNTAYFSFEYPFYFNSEKIETGIYYSRDNSAGRTLPVDKLNISLANGIRINNESLLYAGIQLGYVYKQIDWASTTFPDQYNRETGGFDASLPTADQLETNTSSYLDAGIGLLYHYTLNNGIANAGYSLQQINRPRESFFHDRFNLPVKHIWHSKADIDLSQDFFLLPTLVVVKMGKSHTSLAGVHAGYRLDEWLNQSNNIIAGLHLRNTTMADARSLIFSCGITWQFWTFMVSYDTHIARNNTARFNNQGIEFGMTYKLPSTNLTNKMIPWERY